MKIEVSVACFSGTPIWDLTQILEFVFEPTGDKAGRRDVLRGGIFAPCIDSCAISGPLMAHRMCLRLCLRTRLAEPLPQGFDAAQNAVKALLYIGMAVAWYLSS